MFAKFIVRTTGERDISHIIKEVPDLEICCNNDKNAMGVFLEALEMADVFPAIHLEDDIELCDGFYRAINRIIDDYPKVPINFFSRSKFDTIEGTRFRYGGTFAYNVCFYLPYEMSYRIREYADSWTRFDEHPTGYDIMMQDYFIENGISYLQVVPSIVQHVEGKSLINPKRSTHRQSATFDKAHYLENGPLFIK